MTMNIIKKIIGYVFFDWTYGIAFRTKKDNCFHAVFPTERYSYADPFVVEYKGKTAIFVELMDCQYGWGTIGVFELKNGMVGKVTEIIREKNHMSFPNVFMHNDSLYMIPETYNAGDVHLYKCVEFPYKWERDASLINDVKLVDHSVLNDGDITYVISYDLTLERSRCFTLNWDNMSFEEFYPEGEHSDERPGGTFYHEKGNTYRVIQDCRKCYGDYIKIFSVKELNVNRFCEECVKEIKVENIMFDRGKYIAHTHQYSVSENYEVIDFFYYKFYLFKLFRFLIKTFLHPNRAFM